MIPSIYLADLTHTGLGVSARTFPLGLGCVAASAIQKFGDEITCRLFKFPDDLNGAVARHVPRMMCFSHYVWNSRLTHAFGRAVKKRSPGTVIVCGGPNFPIDRDDRKEYLRLNPHIDFYIKWDGEIAFVELLTRLFEMDWDVDALKESHCAIPNLCYLVGQDYVEGPDYRVRNLTALPSPYLLGLMDEFFDHNLDVLFETTRGCPYACTFCNDGHAARNKIFRKPEELIRQELEYIASRVKPSSELHLADLNYGMYREDLDTSRILRDVIDRFRWPKRVITSVGKSHPDRVLEAANIINGADEGIFKFGASFQSTDPAVLKNIKRKNVPIERLVELRERRSETFEGLEYFTELILPLPGDTVATHLESLRACIDDLEMNNIDVHQLTLLPGTEMAGSNSRRQYSLDVRTRVYVGCMGIYRIGDQEVACAEIEEVVVSSDTMSFDEYLDCREIDLLVKIYIDHEIFAEVFGLIRCLKLSQFDLLLELKNNHLTRYPALVELMSSFRKNTIGSLNDSGDGLYSSLSDKEFIGRYMREELGRNEILTHRSAAYMNASGDLYQALRDAGLAYLEVQGRLTRDMAEYLEQAVRFSQLKRFDPRDVHEQRVGTFRFDFLAATERRFNVDPDGIRIEPTEFRFAHDDRSLSIIENTMEKWKGDRGINFGKLFQKSDLASMARKASMIGE